MKLQFIKILPILILVQTCYSAKFSIYSLRPKYFKPTILTNSTTESLLENSNNKAARAVPQPCGGTFDSLRDDDHGYIESPNYPESYAPGTDCVWTIKAQPGLRIYMTVFDIRTFSDPFSDASDSLFISLIGEWSETQRFSGDLNALTPINLVTQGTDLLIRFKSSINGGNRRGFRLGYHARKKPALLDPADKVLFVTCPYIPVDTPAINPDGGSSKKVIKEPSSPSPDNCKNNEPIELQSIKRLNPTPYLVGLVLDNNQFCSGALVEKEFVITSAHCTSSVKKVELIFGTDDLTVNDAGVQKRIENASSIILHPEFSPSAGLNDISIIKLSKPIQVTRFVKSVRLPSWITSQDSLVGTEAEVAGWGDNNEDGSISVRTNTLPVEISSNAICRTTLHKGLSGMMICVEPNDSNKCGVDSGSPIATRCKNPSTASTRTVEDFDIGQESQGQNDEPFSTIPNDETASACQLTPNILLGVMSFGNCERGYAFTRLNAHLDFISKITGAKLEDFEDIGME